LTSECCSPNARFFIVTDIGRICRPRFEKNFLTSPSGERLA
jgi:hypothetical protein